MNVRDQEFDHREWFDLKALQRYACVSERTLRTWIHRAVDPLPAFRIGTKLFVRRAAFDTWMEAHRVTPIDVDSILARVIGSLRGDRGSR